MSIDLNDKYSNFDTYLYNGKNLQLIRKFDLTKKVIDIVNL